MAKERDGSINIYGSLQAKTEDGYVAYTDGIAHENEDGTKTPLYQLLKGGVGGGGIIDIDKLFQDGWSGTPIPDDTTTIVENLYFNQNLSIEEVVKVLQNANLQMEDVGFGDLKAYYITYPDSYLGDYGKITYMILYSVTYDVWLIANFWAAYSVASGTAISESQILFSSKQLPDFEILLEGWNTSITMPIEYNNRIYFEKPKIKQNVSLLPIVSSTPFLNSDKNPDEKIVYRLKKENKNIVLGYKGTAVPNSGVLEKIYFNTSLNKAEVNDVLNNLTWINASNLGQSGFEFYPVLAYMQGSYPYVLAFKKYTEAIGSHSIGDINGAIINFANMDTIQDFYIFASGGWQTFTNPYPINAALLSELSGIPIGTQNDIISSLISKTEFEEEYAGKYTYWVFKNKWLQLIDSDNMPEIEPFKSDYLYLQSTHEEGQPYIKGTYGNSSQPIPTNAIKLDSVPTQYSKNLIDSGAVYEALQNVGGSAIVDVDVLPEEPKSDVIYRLKENEQTFLGYTGTAVPNSGTFGSLYINKTIGITELKNTLNKLSWTNASALGQSGFEFYPMLAYMNGSYPYALAFKKYTQNDGIYEIGDINIAIINFANMAIVQGIFDESSLGWKDFTNPYPINSTLLSQLSGISIGTQNDLISSIFSSTLFMPKEGSKYTYWIYKDKWVQLNDSNELYIIEKSFPGNYTQTGFNGITLEIEEIEKSAKAKESYLILYGERNRLYFRKALSEISGNVTKVCFIGSLLGIDATIPGMTYPYPQNSVIIFTTQNTEGIVKDASPELVSFEYTSPQYISLSLFNGRITDKVSLPYDNVPQKNSNQLVSSGGVYTALQKKQNKITVTENDDGTVDITIPTE